jgi:hypothetical protein
MGKYDEDFKRLQGYDNKYPLIFFLSRIADELAEANRLTRQRLTMPIGNVLDIEEAVDQA